MAYELSFCKIEQLSENTFEVTINDDVTIDGNCAREAQLFWHELRNEPYGLLVNASNQFVYSFDGARKIGGHPLERKTAILIDSKLSKDQMEVVLDIKSMFDRLGNKRVYFFFFFFFLWLEAP